MRNIWQNICNTYERLYIYIWNRDGLWPPPQRGCLIFIYCQCCLNWFWHLFHVSVLQGEPWGNCSFTCFDLFPTTIGNSRTTELKYFYYFIVFVCRPFSLWYWWRCELCEFDIHDFLHGVQVFYYVFMVFGCFIDVHERGDDVYMICAWRLYHVFTWCSLGAHDVYISCSCCSIIRRHVCLWLCCWPLTPRRSTHRWAADPSGGHDQTCSLMLYVFCQNSNKTNLGHMKSGRRCSDSAERFPGSFGSSKRVTWLVFDVLLEMVNMLL